MVFLEDMDSSTAIVSIGISARHSFRSILQYVGPYVYAFTQYEEQSPDRFHNIRY